nr:transport and Golgi organization protein 1 homolog [Cavia porcellus]
MACCSQVSMASKGPPAYPGLPFLGGPMLRPVDYGPPPTPTLCGPFRPRPMPLQPLLTFVPRMGPPLGLREHAPSILPGRCDLLLHPREFLPAPVPFRPPGPLGPREYFIPAPRMPPQPTGPQDYPPPPGAPALGAQRGPSLTAKQPGTCPSSEAERIMAPLIRGPRFILVFEGFPYSSLRKGMQV